VKENDKDKQPASSE